MTYEQWMTAVDTIVTKTCGLPMICLPDWLSRDAYEDELTPYEGAKLCLEEAGYYEYVEREDDGEALASAGFGTDEDYGVFDEP
jgi:hypothetical protein